MKVIIAGSRNFNDYDLLKVNITRILQSIEGIEIVSGTARGADQLGEQYAKEFKLTIKRFPADWDKHGKAAGYIRNEEMAIYANVLIAFWDGVSKGTKHMIDLATKHGLTIHIIRY